MDDISLKQRLDHIDSRLNDIHKICVDLGRSLTGNSAVPLDPALESRLNTIENAIRQLNRR